jgi:hypothetical protein
LPQSFVVAPASAVYSDCADFLGASEQGNAAVAVALVRGKQDSTMSEPFRPYEKLVDITILGKKFQVPERNSLLRCFQFISPETIPMDGSAGIRNASIAACPANCRTTMSRARC